MQWGDRWTWPEGGGPVRALHAECGHDVRVEVRCPHCERALAPGELAAELSGHGGVAPAPGEPGHLSGRRLAGSRALLGDS